LSRQSPALPASIDETLSLLGSASYVGDRALATVISHETLNSPSTSTAACMTGASESDPMRIRMSGICDLVIW